MHCQLLSLTIFTVTVQLTLAQDHFRSVLVERACQKRPSLDFCAEFSTAPPTTTKSEAKADAPRRPNLVLPPNPDHVPALPTPPSVPVSTTSSPVTSSEKDKGKEQLGSLLRLPKPASRVLPEEKPKEALSEEEFPELTDEDVKGNATALADVPEVATSSTTSSTNKTTSLIEDGTSVLVFVSEYCVVEREHFVRSCHGNTPENEVPFCKSYPPACASTQGVIPVVSYCQRYYKYYPKHCTSDTVENDVIQFCFAFEQFCLPELTPAKQQLEKPKSSLKRCEDIVDEARKVCNPFPNPKDTFNVLRCSQFLTNCKKFVDWA